MSLSEAYKNLCQTTDITISRSKFCELRPKHIKLFDQIPHNVCVCLYHENIRLLLLALQDESPLPENTSQFTELMVCDTDNKKCMTQECILCKNKIDRFIPHASDDRSIHYYQWQKSSSYEKVQLTGSASKVFAELKSQMRKFLIHVYVKRKQAFMNDLKAKVGGKKVVVQVDFSENASLGFQNEIQAVHWSHRQATLFTCHAWITSDKRESIVLISDDLQHTKLSVNAYMSKVFTILKQKHPLIEEMHVLSDGASSQFKQRFLFSNLYRWEKDFDIKLQWHFFATSHGKGVVDGLGGTVKRSVWRYVRSGKACASNPMEFYHVAKERNPEIQIEFVSQEHIEKDRYVLNEHWDKTCPIPNTQQLHSVIAHGPNCVLVGETSDADKIMMKISNDEHNDISQSGEDISPMDVSSDVSNEVIIETNLKSQRAEDEHRDRVQKSLHQFAQYVHPQYTVVPVPSDGNCFFWALKQQLEQVGLQSYKHSELRQMLADHMQRLSHEEKLKLMPFMTKPYDTYVIDMAKDGTYADHISVMLMSQLLCVKIVVHQETGDTTIGSCSTKIHIGYLPCISHYVALKPSFSLDPSSILRENYYAVYYTELTVDYYIGRTISADCTCDSIPQKHAQMKFLKYNILTKSFDWPRRCELECVPKQFIFKGPLILVGSGPFKIDLQAIADKFENVKKCY